MKYFEVSYSSLFDKELYLNPKINGLFNEVNKYTLKNINKVCKLYSNKVFKVPSYIKECAWGNEKIFLTFSNKLFKVIDTSKNDTSIQLHPIKKEIWYPMKESVINDGKKDIVVNTTDEIIIKENTVHSLRKNSVVFEVQDNTLFNHLETIRIYDESNRKIHEDKFYSHNMPMFRNKIKIIKRINSKKCILKNNSFIFSFDNVKVLNDKEYKINKNELWYLSKGTKILSDGDYIVINCKFFKI